jgi:DNA-binding NarL/FixJ family response regulator
MRGMLASEEGLEIVGEATTGREAVSLCRRLRPDVVLMDIRMPDLDGLAATRSVKQESPGTCVIIVTMHENPEYLLEAFKAGAAGYLLKDTPASELLSAIRRVNDGESIIQPSIATRLIAEFTRRRTAQREPEYEPLSDRERDVLRLLADVHSNREIAARLILAEGTVKNHVSTILDKLHAANRTQAARVAREQGLI